MKSAFTKTIKGNSMKENEREQKMDNEVTKTQKNSECGWAIFTIIFSVVFWMLLIGKPFVFLYAYDTLYKVLCVIQYILVLCIVYCCIKSLVFIKSQKPRSKSSHIILKISGLIVILAFNLFSWGLLGLGEDDLQTSGYFSIDKKYDEGGKYYISINSEDAPTVLSVDKETHDALIVDENVSYSMEYRTIHLSPKGVLENPLDVNQYIDNRNRR